MEHSRESDCDGKAVRVLLCGRCWLMCVWFRFFRWDITNMFATPENRNYPPLVMSHSGWGSPTFSLITLPSTLTIGFNEVASRVLDSSSLKAAFISSILGLSTGILSFTFLSIPVASLEWISCLAYIFCTFRCTRSRTWPFQREKVSTAQKIRQESRIIQDCAEDSRIPDRKMAINFFVCYTKFQYLVVSRIEDYGLKEY